jgi:hypothetical protein
MAAAADDAGSADGEHETQGRLASQGIEIDQLAAMTARQTMYRDGLPAGDYVGES